MIISVSRRTDIPCYYSDWFFERMRQGYVYVRNPMNSHQVSKILLNRENVDCIVFWTKNPQPMISRLTELGDIPYYFQFTITGYGRDIEPGLPDKRSVILPTFIQLASMIGKERMILRYDPILMNEKYTLQYHCKAFEEIVGTLSGYTNQVVISFLDYYTKITKNLKEQGIRSLEEDEVHDIAREFSRIAKKYGMKIVTCAEKYDLSEWGIGHSCCIDPNIIESILQANIKDVEEMNALGETLRNIQLATKLKSLKKDKNQRVECGCVESIDIGAYNTCRNGCRYCYANVGQEVILRNYACYDSSSDVLCSKVTEEERMWAECHVR